MNSFIDFYLFYFCFAVWRTESVYLYWLAECCNLLQIRKQLGTGILELHLWKRHKKCFPRTVLDCKFDGKNLNRSS